MKLITRDTDYAVRALCFIDKHKENLVSVTELVNRLKIPRSFLRKILQILNSEGILSSYKGQGGGFTLARKADSIFLVNLIEIFQGTLRLNECFFKKRDCPSVKICPLKKRIDAVEKKLINELKSITIASLLREGSEKIWQKGK